jgi:asparagine synthase (glutamine-hydrolysing)
MCGLAGFVDFSKGTTAERATQIATRMASTLTHRGPDDAGLWVDAAAGIALSHRRLSIIDLSPTGRQPMVSSSGRFVVVYNGEIYNFPSLRAELAGLGARFRGESDTEVALEAFERWGVPRSLERFNGMFAIALWDRRDRAIYFARDRFGEKPLYYGMAGRALVFGSELKALRPHPWFVPELDRASLAQFMRFGYVPAPKSIMSGVRKLLPATWLRIAGPEDVEASPTAYWSLRDVARRAAGDRFSGDVGEAVDRTDALLRDSIRARMIADVPLGAFLSGGIDSSTVVALMQAQSPQAIKTFTIGFHEGAYNEADSAAAIARHLGTDHTELYVTPRDMQAVVPNLPRLYDEPFADSSQVPTFLVAQLARRSVTVALSGDGGDELFGGYNRYVWAASLWKWMAPLPVTARAAFAHAILSVSPSTWAAWFRHAEPWLPSSLHQRLAGDKLHKLAELLTARDGDALYRRLLSTWNTPSSVIVEGNEGPAPCDDVALRHAAPDFVERMMLADSLMYLPDDILVKVDRAAMGVSLETRVPLLDPSLAAFTWSLPTSMKVRRREGKFILRNVLAKYVPRPLFERPKMGFGIPVGEWLRGPLRDWAESALSEDGLRADGIFRPEPIRRKWQEHLSGQRNWEYALWFVLMFQHWNEYWRRSSSTETTPPDMGVDVTSAGSLG